MKISKTVLEEVIRLSNLMDVQELTLNDRLRLSTFRVKMLAEYIDLVNTNSLQIQIPKNNNPIMQPESLLLEYLILEIVNFYKLALKAIKDPSILPSYFGTLKIFRNTMPAHLDEDQKVKSWGELRDLYTTIFFEIGLDKILLDFLSTIEKCEKMLKIQLIEDAYDTKQIPNNKKWWQFWKKN